MSSRELLSRRVARLKTVRIAARHDEWKVMPLISEAMLKKREGGGYQLTAPLRFYSRKFKRDYVVPEGFVTDLISGVAVPEHWLMGKQTVVRVGPLNTAAILHDGLVPAPEAHAVFYEAMEDGGVPWWQRTLAYSIVSIFGASWLFYKDQEDT